MNIFIVGPMGSGKSTVGKIISNELFLNFFDTDEEIESRTGASIDWIFDLEGEEGFRKREKDVLLEIKKTNSSVVSTGAGLVLEKNNRELLASNGKVIYLDVSIESQLKRTTFDKTRPLLSKGDKREILLKMSKDRDHLYKKLADITIKAGKKSCKEIIEEIASKIKTIEDGPD